jgi:very-short-patch-repair endonuclease
MTVAEKKLWLHLRGDQLDGLRFRRQHRVGEFIADFYCAARLLVIELDGTSHFLSETQDARRDVELTARGLCVLRFQNGDVLHHVDSVVQAIREACARVENEMHPLPNPLPEYRERE